MRTNKQRITDIGEFINIFFGPIIAVWTSVRGFVILMGCREFLSISTQNGLFFFRSGT